MSSEPATPPRLVVRATIATLATVVFVLSAVFIVVTLDVRNRVRGNVVSKLEAGQRMLSELEERRAEELQGQVATLAENPTLKAALDTYQSELPFATDASKRELLATVSRELEKVAARLRHDVLAVADANGRTVAAAGRRKLDWPVDAALRVARDNKDQRFLTLPTGIFRVAAADMTFQDATIGTLQLATALDQKYADELSKLSGAGTLITSGTRVIATTLEAGPARALTPDVLRTLGATPTIRLDRSEYAVRLLGPQGNAGVYVLESIDGSAAPALGNALRAIFTIALAAFGLAGFASIWLARTIASPIDTLSRSLSEMTRSRDFDNPVVPTGSSLEVDTLTHAFNSMMQSVSSAEAETRNAYVGAIRALAMALDARDPYTAGHSERVSAVSVAIGRQMRVGDDDLDILRLGALLHDIGKIGISDHVLRKPGPLTPEEFEVIKQHPGLGARILRSVSFLAPHLPIVELHHERPDGLGYPHQLRGDEIPLLARIVHVADAFDAMTSARAYRPARGAAEALRELWRCAGTQFDAEVVQALASALPSIDISAAPVSAISMAAIPARRLSVVGFGRS